MKFYLKLVWAFIVKFRFIIFFGIVFGIFVFLFTIKIIPQTINRKTVIGVVGKIESTDIPLYITNLISKGLVEVSPDNKITPSIAKSWKNEGSGKKWIFYLRDDLVWHDGKKLTSYDINYNFKNVNLVKPDENTLIFELENSYIPFINLLEKPVFKKGFIGVGEWKVKKILLEGGKVGRVEIKKGNEVKIFKFYPTEEQVKLAFKLGEVDFLHEIFSPTPFDKWETVNIEKKIKNDQVVVIFFNTNDSVLSDKSFRQALNYSINKDLFENKALTSYNPQSYYYNPSVKEYSYNVQRAKELLKESKVKIPENYSLKIISTTNLTSTADMIAKMWKELGINTEVLVSSNIPQDYQVFLTILDIPKDPDQYSLWHSSQDQTNITNYKNLRIDKLLEEGRIEENQEERKKIYLDLQRYLAEDSPAIFLYHPVCYNIGRK